MAAIPASIAEFLKNDRRLPFRVPEGGGRLARGPGALRPAGAVRGGGGRRASPLWAGWLRDELLAPVAHRHVVLTIPRLLRPLLCGRRDLLLTTNGGFAPDGRFLPLPEWDATLLMGLFRERILTRVLDRHAISKERPGDAHAGGPAPRGAR